MAKIKRDDEVIIIAGRDKGKRGTVRQVLDTGKLIVSGINMIKKHTKPNPQAGVAGGIVLQGLSARLGWLGTTLVQMICAHRAAEEENGRTGSEIEVVRGILQRAAVDL